MPRGTVEGLVVPQPIGHMLPAVYFDNEFIQQLTQAFDAVLAPVNATLDCQDAYFDPWTAPADFLEWLAGWVGVALDETFPLPRRREIVAEAVRLFRSRGTAKGLREEIAMLTGAEVEVEESGGCTWSEVPGAAPPGSAAPSLTVRIRHLPAEVDRERVCQLVRRSAPAHVPCTVEVVDP